MQFFLTDMHDGPTYTMPLHLAVHGMSNTASHNTYVTYDADHSVGSCCRQTMVIL